MTLYICTKFGENVSTVFKVIELTPFPTEIFKGYNFLKNEGRVMALNLCTSSHDALCLVKICTKFHENILDGIKVIERTQFK